MMTRSRCRGVSLNLSEQMITFGSILRTYVDFEPKQQSWYDFLDVWLSGTHIYKEFLNYPQILAEQNIQTGKSRIMDVGSALSFRGEKHDNITYASLRDLASEGHTLFIDEFKRVDDNTLKILKNGWERTGQDTKNVKGVPVRIPTYSPKMFATNSSKIGPDIKQRTILMPTLGTTKDMPRFNAYASAWDKVRGKRAKFMEKNLKTVLAEYENAPRTVGGIHLTNREYQQWSPLLAIAKVLGLNIDQLCKETVEYSRLVISSQYPEAFILRTLHDMVKGSSKLYLAEDIDREIRNSLSIDERPYYHSGELGNQMGRIFGRTLVRTRLQHGSKTAYELSQDSVEQAIQRAIARGVYVPASPTPSSPISLTPLHPDIDREPARLIGTTS